MAKNDKHGEGITVSKDENFSEWYTQVIMRSEMLDYYDVSGCYILRPWSFFIWEQIHNFIDQEIKKLGVMNVSFPLFVSKKRLETEKSHVEGFSPEVAWVTKYGDSDLPEPIAIRPTSEAVMYPSYANWIRSHRDLPLLLNQWNSVVRWEFKQPTPFIRSREFLWQEGHTVHATEKEAMEFMHKILDIYSRAYSELLAVPMIKGIKSQNERFAGGHTTSTIETLVPQNGRAIQAATSHYLGQNFSKMFNIEFEDDKGEKQFGYQTSWGYTTRSIGVMVLLHGDNRGLVLPPRVAPKQVVIIPIVYKEENTTELIQKCNDLMKTLGDAGVRATVDDRTNYNPGFKYNHWEVKGVPIRLELGPRDMKNCSARLCRRDTSEKKDVPWTEVVSQVNAWMDDIQKGLLSKAEEGLKKGVVKATEWKEVVPHVKDRKLVMVPWCEDPESENNIRTESAKEPCDDTMTTSVKSICIPLEQPEMPEGQKCFFTGKPAKSWTIFGRSY